MGRSHLRQLVNPANKVVRRGRRTDGRVSDIDVNGVRGRHGAAVLDRMARSFRDRLKREPSRARDLDLLVEIRPAAITGQRNPLDYRPVTYHLETIQRRNR